MTVTNQYSMEQNYSSEASNPLTDKEVTRLLWSM